MKTIELGRAAPTAQDLEEIKRTTKLKLESIFAQARELVRQGKSPLDGKSLSTNGERRKGKERAPLENGMKAPTFSVPRVRSHADALAHGGSAETVSLDEIKGKRLLVIARPNCPGCVMLMEELPRIQREHAELTVVVISSGTPEENREKFGNVSELPFVVGLEPSPSSGKSNGSGFLPVSRAYAIKYNPWSVLIDENGLLIDA